jgi:hypothetical protein
MTLRDGSNVANVVPRKSHARESSAAPGALGRAVSRVSRVSQKAALTMQLLLSTACSSTPADTATNTPVSTPTAAGTIPVSAAGSKSTTAAAAAGTASKPTTAAGAAAGSSAAPTGTATAGTLAAVGGSHAAGSTGAAVPDGVAVTGAAGALSGTAGSATGAAGATGGASGTSSASASAGSGAGAPSHEDLGKGDGTDVIAIGDSWMLLSVSGIQLSLVRLSGQKYRTYGVPGTQLLNGQIPGQYTSAKQANPDIKTVVMTGGGNDLLLTGQTTGTGATDQINKVSDGLVKLWNEMGADGVKDIVYIEYSRGGTNEMNVNTGTAKIQPLCEGLTSTRCHWVDSDLYIMKMLMGDGIHPTADGCDKIAKAVIDLMEKEGMRR